MLPPPSERAGAEFSRRLEQFRQEISSLGGGPTRAGLESLLTRARELGLPEEEIAGDVAAIRASLEALDLDAQIAQGEIPVVAATEPLAPGDVCHFMTPVRFGRRRADQFGHLSLTAASLKFRGALDLSVAWTEVAGVQRVGGEIIVALHHSKRVLRFSCHTLNEAARGGVLAQHLARRASTLRDGPGTTPHDTAL